MKLWNFIISFDNLGPSPELVHKSSSKYTTIVGLLLSLLILGFSLDLFKDEFGDFWNNRNPKIKKTGIYNSGETFETNGSSLNFFFQVQSFNTTNMEEIKKQELEQFPDYLQPHVFVMKKSLLKFEYLNLVNESEKVASTELNETILQLEFCDNATFWDNYNSHLSYGQSNYSQEKVNNLRYNSYCLPKKLSKNLLQEDDYNIMLSIVFGKEFTEELMKHYESIFITLHYQTLELNFQNTSYYDNKQYYRKVWKYKNFYVDSNHSLSEISQIQRSVIKVDKTAFLVKQEEESTTYTIESSNTWFRQPSSKDPNEQFSFLMQFEMNPYYNEIEIQYKSLSDILGNFGGTYELLKVFGEIIVGIIITPFLNASLLNKLFHFHSNNNNAKEVEEIIRTFKFATQNEKKEINLKKKENNDLNDVRIIDLNIDKTDKTDKTIEIENPNKQNFSKTESNINKDNKKEIILNRSDQSDNSKQKVIELQDFSLSKNINLDHNNPRLIPQNIRKSFFLDIKKKLSKRKKYVVSFMTMIKLQYCSCTLNYRDKAIQKAMDYMNNMFEVSSILKTKREIDMIKLILLKRNQREAYLLPSINVDNGEIDNLEDKNFNEKMDISMKHKYKYKYREDRDDQHHDNDHAHAHDIEDQAEAQEQGQEECKEDQSDNITEDLIDLLNRMDFNDIQSFKLGKNIIKSIV